MYHMYQVTENIQNVPGLRYVPVALGYRHVPDVPVYRYIADVLS